MIKSLVLKLIKFYQIVLSPDNGFLRLKYPSGVCRFYPSCSHYTYQAVEKYGAISGLLKGARRILKCHPFNAGGVDLLK